MNYLKSGGYNAKKLEIMISLTRINSEAVISAINDHLVRGASIENAAALNGIPASNLVRAREKLNAVAEKVERIKEMDWSRFKSHK